jgi:hypothetical protein
MKIDCKIRRSRPARPAVFAVSAVAGAISEADNQLLNKQIRLPGLT